MLSLSVFVQIRMNSYKTIRLCQQHSRNHVVGWEAFFLLDEARMTIYVQIAIKALSMIFICNRLIVLYCYQGNCLSTGEQVSLPSAKKICIVCEKNIDITRGNEIKRCYYCNNTICNKHYSTCRICSNLICENEVRECDYCASEQCKTCTLKYKNNKSNTTLLCCLHCSAEEKEHKRSLSL